MADWVLVVLQKELKEDQQMGLSLCPTTYQPCGLEHII